MKKTIIIIKNIYSRYMYYLGIKTKYNPYESIDNIKNKIKLEIISILYNIDLNFDKDFIINKNIWVIKWNKFYTLYNNWIEINQNVTYINSLSLEDDKLYNFLQIFNSWKYYNSKIMKFNKNIIKKLDSDIKVFHWTNSLNIKSIERYWLDSKYLFSPIFFSKTYDYSKTYYADSDDWTGKVYEITLKKWTEYIITTDIEYLNSAYNIEDNLKYLYLLSLWKIKFINYLRWIRWSNRDWFLNYNSWYLKSNEFYNNFFVKYIYRIIAYIEGLKLIYKFRTYNAIIKKHDL